MSVAPTRARLDGPYEAKEWKPSHSMRRAKPMNLVENKGGARSCLRLLPRASAVTRPCRASFRHRAEPAHARCGTEAVDGVEGAGVEGEADELE